MCLRADGFRIVARGGDRGFVQEICQIRAGESRRAASHPIEIEFGIELHVCAHALSVSLRARARQARLTMISRSNRPGRVSARSNTSGRFVDPMTTMLEL